MADKYTILIGGGGHARSLVEVMPPDSFDAYVATSPSPEGMDIPYVGDDSKALSSLDPDTCAIHIAVGYSAGASLSLRRRIIETYKDFEPVSMIAPSAVVTASSTIGPGTAVMARAVVNRSSTGKHCVINTGAVIDHDCCLGSNVFVGPGAIICGEVQIGNDVFIGAGAVIRNGISIASGARIAMGATVTAPITSPGLYLGSPAKKMTE
ncbi:MAG: NeuD/PglB/VioB family sugar acetyltransferase [Paramuribaculum sp.]|nr:NeuD/PglB/VioB family sugar acetyltransferase [Paramuribaculum sp.]MDE6322907.1 NeuD/PglB/VioB family sugar acetyltransferase [Paramuribaculum sp.]MDE6487782.1 NeuD/PglB/VioB family sugar acetyltransferase [Paramuribaculum sp.]